MTFLYRCPDFVVALDQAGLRMSQLEGTTVRRQFRPVDHPEGTVARKMACPGDFFNYQRCCSSSRPCERGC